MLKTPAKKNTQEALMALSHVALCLEPTKVMEFVTEVSNILTKYSNIPVRQKAIDCLAAFIPRLNQVDLSTMMPVIAQKLSDVDKTVRQKALRWISKYISYAQPSDLALFALIKNHLNDENRNVRDAAIECLTALIPLLSSEHFFQVILVVINQLVDGDKK